MRSRGWILIVINLVVFIMIYNKLSFFDREKGGEKVIINKIIWFCLRE